MGNANSWRLKGEWQAQQGRVNVSLHCDDQEALVSGAVQYFDNESLRVYLGDRPPSLSDPATLQLITAIFQYLDRERDDRFAEIGEEVDLLKWLTEHVGTTSAAALWTALSFEHAQRQVYPPPSPFDDKPLFWRFSAQWQESPGSDWRLARLALTWHRGEESGGLEAIAKATCCGETVVKTIVSDDLLLGHQEMNWLFRQLLEQYRRQILAHGDVRTDLDNFVAWLGRRRGRNGQRILGLIQSAMRTFGDCRSQQG